MSALSRVGRPVGADFSREAAWGAGAGRRIAGIDEAGRGPLAGPVLAAAVVLDPARIPDGIADSKALSPARREALAAALSDAASIGIGQASVAEIDRLNILNASLLAMARALEALAPPADAALIDGNRAPDIALPWRTVVKGDAVCLSIAAASIVAKVTRDRIMRELDTLYPRYGFARHKGYATAAHRAALAQHGPCPAHRRSFHSRFTFDH